MAWHAGQKCSRIGLVHDATGFVIEARNINPPRSYAKNTTRKALRMQQGRTRRNKFNPMYGGQAEITQKTNLTQHNKPEERSTDTP
jgi:hypothetical protein